MSDELLQILKLHPGLASLSPKVLDLLQDLNQDASAVILAWELAGLAPGLAVSQRERLFATGLALQVAQGQGHTRMALNPVVGSPSAELFRAFGLGSFDLKAFLRLPDLASIVGSPGEARPLILQEDWLYSHRLLGQERELAGLIANLRSVADQVAVPVDEEVFCDPVLLNGEQRLAVGMALAGSLTLITGGPGSGKTSIVVSILRALLHHGLVLEDIALAAPTGKAAQRMGESIRDSLGKLKVIGDVERTLIEATLEPKTLHRLLAWHPAAERFRHGPGNPLPARVVIVDEASMISQEHMFRLLAALAAGARLVLLGDADQLPSVEAGCAFRDMVSSLAGNRAELITSYRMREDDAEGRNILSVARVINDPGTGQLWDGEEPIHCRESLEELTFQKVELLEPSLVGMKAFLDLWFAREVTSLEGFPSKAGRVFRFHEGAWEPGDEEALEVLFEHFTQFRILCALREAKKDLRGVEEINDHLHKRMLHLTGDGLRGQTPFCAGEPILMTANDYRRGIFNGDQGLILKVGFEGQVRQAAVFPRMKGFIPFPLDPLKHQLEHAYAMTVHKSQGSEYTRIAIVLPRTNHRALTKELLYTGLTRARKSVILLAERERIPFASGNPTVRDSGLAERLSETEDGGVRVLTTGSGKTFPSPT